MRKWVLLCAAALLCARFAHASEVDDLMSRYQGDVPGASLLVIKDGKPLVSRGYGWANLETHEAATPASNYRLASVSKQFTAAAILLLAERGKLSLDDHVRHWLPELPAAHEQITLRQLLSHAGGLIDYEDLMPANATAQISDADVLRMLAAEPRSYFPPGTAYRYSNGGYVLLGLVVERASGQPLPDFLAQNIFQPLGMRHTLLYVRGGPEVAHRAYGYSEENGHWSRTDQSPTSATRGDGGIYSSIDDLARWDAALYDHRLLSDGSRRIAFSAQNKVSDEADVDSYGYGWRIHGDVLWHSGESMGFRNVIIRWPKQHLTVILLSNRNDPEPYRTALAIGQPFLPR
ncbi:serine hydrolase domain-containing protein [Dyella japonica]|uniref:Beta-lactamase n=1 Tax=Dyella japonica DSM 16301 TaxID=1440762 RepID=A0A0G9H4V2_9GAMM|nr:serine hydrolase domain-containing protein [Dyella japonica]KLD62722.1 beta-lactamase [Dyella japonica DSM 16301]